MTAQVQGDPQSRKACECGAKLAPDAHFCSACGKPVLQHCAACGHTLEPSSRFCSGCGVAVVGGMAEAPPNWKAQAATSADGERRQVTIAFCDMVGSTALASRLDPEDMRAVIHLQRERCSVAVRKQDGHVLRHLGDGILICFGYPEAHEDDAVRAVRAALDIQRMIAEARDTDQHPTEIRIGIATGLVVTGDISTDVIEPDLSIVGDAPNRASRLQELAPPGGVVVGALTRRLIGDHFSLTDLGPKMLKGLDTPERPALVTGERRSVRVTRREEGDPAATELRGRSWESALVADRWDAVLHGTGQVVLINGEAGIGKSRLVEAIVSDTRAHRPNILQFTCQTHYRNTAFSPVIEELERWVGGRDRNRDPAARLRALRRTLGPELGADDTATTLAAGLLGIPTAGVLPPLGLSPQQVRVRTQQLLLDMLAHIPSRRPLILIVEDCHWIDASSAELLERMVAAIVDRPTLALITGRPEFRPDWIDQPHVVALSLGKLDSDHAEQIIQRVAGKPLPSEVVAQILSRTDGVPLFVEELTKSVLESGQLTDAGDRYVVKESLPHLTVPETLRDSLMSRLDRLGPARRVAQLGAIIGREFRYDLLEMVADEPARALEPALAELCHSGLISSRGAIPHSSYTFKHALVQDTAARSMLKRHRAAAHGRIARTLTQRFPELAAQRPELVAQHYAEAGKHDLALDYFERAGRATLARSNYVEGISHLRHALKSLRELEEGPERGERELNLLVALGGALIATRGYAAPEPGEVYARAVNLCRSLHDGAISGPIYYGLSIYHTVRGEIAQAVELAEQFKRAADAQSDADLHLVANRTLGAHTTFAGEWDRAERHLRRALDLYDPARHRDLALAYAQDARIASLTLQSWCAFFSGRLSESEQISRRALEEAVELKHLHSLAYARGLAGAMLPQFSGDIAKSRRGAEDLIALSSGQPVPLWTGLAIALHGWAIGANGDLDAGVQRINEGVDEFTKTGSRLFLPYYKALIADIYLRAGDITEANRYFVEAQKVMVERPEGWFAPELQRQAAAALVTRDGRPDAKARYAALIACLDAAEAGGHRLVALRAARDLCALAQDQGWSHAPETARLRETLSQFAKEAQASDVVAARAVLARSEA